MKSSKYGFTLIEILVATVISSVIVIASYSVFNSIITVKSSTSLKNNLNTVKNKLAILINGDINSSLNREPEKSDSFDEKFSVVSFNSLFFNRSLPVTVVYSLEDDFLVRKEINSSIGFERKIKLIGGIKRLEVLYYDGNEYTETENKSFICKFVFETIDGNFEIIAGKLLL